MIFQCLSHAHIYFSSHLLQFFPLPPLVRSISCTYFVPAVAATFRSVGVACIRRFPAFCFMYAVFCPLERCDSSRVSPFHFQSK